jgi:hypothetical protein
MRDDTESQSDSESVVEVQANAGKGVVEVPPAVPFVTRKQAGALAAQLPASELKYEYPQEVSASPPQVESEARGSAFGSLGLTAGSSSGLVPIHVSLNEIDRELEKSFAIIKGRAAARCEAKSRGGAARTSRSSSSGVGPGQEALRQWEDRHKRQFVEFEADRLAAKLTSRKF